VLIPAFIFAGQNTFEVCHLFAKRSLAIRIALDSINLNRKYETEIPLTGLLTLAF
jgi:hypothetical protein